MTYRFTLLLLAFALGLTTLWGVPAKRRTLSFTQPDGTVLTLRPTGDEHCHYYLTSDGVAVMRNTASRTLCYATCTDGRLTASDCLAHEAADRSAAEATFVRQAQRTIATSWQPPRLTLSQDGASTDDGLGRYGLRSVGVVNSIGRHTIPVILVNFADVSLRPATTHNKVTRLFNEEGYADEQGCEGSTRDYFLAQSGGMFDPTFEVVATVTVAHEASYYGSNDASGMDRRVMALAKEAVQLAMAQGVDFSKYVEDEKVPLVSILYAGEGEHDSWKEGTALEDLIWAHFSGSGFTVGDYRFAGYFMGNESYQQWDWNEPRMEGIGLFCHEFSHALGLPDFYGTTAQALDNATPGWWSLMDYGEYWGGGYAPTAYTAYERSFMGWLDVQELGDEVQYNVALYPQGREHEGATAYVVRNPAHPQEYYVLENRQGSKWAPYALGSGMLVMHIDYKSRSWYLNTLNNNANHLGCQVVAADNKWQSVNYSNYTDWKGDLFPGSKRITMLTDEQDLTAARAFYGDGGFGRPIYNITETPDHVITFSYLTRETDGIASATAAPTPSAATYSIDGRRVKGEALQHGIYISAGRRIIR